MFPFGDPAPLALKVEALEPPVSHTVASVYRPVECNFAKNVKHRLCLVRTAAGRAIPTLNNTDTVTASVNG